MNTNRQIGLLIVIWLLTIALYLIFASAGLAAVDEDRYIEFAAEVDQLSETQRTDMVLEGFVVMEPGRTRSYDRKMITPDMLETFAVESDYVTAVINHAVKEHVNFGVFRNFRVEDGILVADLHLAPIDDYNRTIADGIRVVYYLYPHRAMLSAGLTADWQFIMEISFVIKGAATSRLLK